MWICSPRDCCAVIVVVYIAGGEYLFCVCGCSLALWETVINRDFSVIVLVCVSSLC